MLLNCGVGEDSWESLGLQGDQTSHPKGNQSWIFTGRTDAEAETPYFGQLMWRTDSFAKTLMLGKVEDRNRGWDGWMVSLTQWTWVWVSSRSWWWTGKPGVLQSMGSQRVRHDWATELSWASFLVFMALCLPYSETCPLRSLVQFLKLNYLCVCFLYWAARAISTFWSEIPFGRLSFSFC